MNSLALVTVCLAIVLPYQLAALPLATPPDVDFVENAAKLLIDLDEAIQHITQPEPSLDHFYLDQDIASVNNNVSVIDDHRQDKFASVSEDLAGIEEHIKIAITKANDNRQFRLVMRLRPLQSYVNHLRRNMETLRTRVVSVATLSNLAFTVNEVLDQFGDVMLNSINLPSATTRPNRIQIPSRGSPANASTSPPSVAHLDSEHEDTWKASN